MDEDWIHQVDKIRQDSKSTRLQKILTSVSRFKLAYIRPHNNYQMNA
jgi:hypothetical protein